MAVSAVTSGKIAHFNIPDMHTYHDLANRKDYFGEILSIVQRLGKMVVKYKKLGYHCIAILNGDVAHRGNANDSMNDKSVQLIKLLLSYFDETYLNFGNHEFTYFKNNPILKFIYEIEDLRVNGKYPHIKGQSLTPDIRAVTNLTYEDFEIGFTPYGMMPQKLNKKYRHLIVHDNIISNNAYNRLGTEMLEYKIDRMGINDDDYDYVYCGHMHLVCEKWMSANCVIYNLSTLGRSNATEVRDDMRHRIIPIILSEDGYFKEVAEETLTLHKREDVIDEDKLMKSQEAYLATKERKALRESLSINRSANPVEALLQDVALSEDPYLHAIMGQLEVGNVIDFRRIRNILKES